MVSNGNGGRARNCSASDESDDEEVPIGEGICLLFFECLNFVFTIYICECWIFVANGFAAKVMRKDTLALRLDTQEDFNGQTSDERRENMHK